MIASKVICNTEYIGAGMFALREINQENEMCNYLDWKLTTYIPHSLSRKYT
ncbi:hypothetical protein B0H13DRAFT_1982954 [Mycena leptocephala]|nr:hypothetical protein B0H13DRAFT_1982954 [Mycena leptocephala]